MRELSGRIEVAEEELRLLRIDREQLTRVREDRLAVIRERDRLLGERDAARREAGVLHQRVLELQEELEDLREDLAAERGADRP